MNSLNKVQLIGNLTRDPELRQTPNGTMVCNIGLATNRVFISNGDKQEQVEFHDIVLWGKLAEIVNTYLKKGNKVYVEGRLQTRNWEDQTGIKRYKTEIVGENLIMLGGKISGSSSGDEIFSSNDEMMIPEEITASKSKKVKPKEEEEINIEDIPF
ncbi:MAG: single-stranded DNA-binding protein [Candidatus Gracilibacteria bacterium]|nr:single-stranded DNA-binding protein [Candidatus Gracilibacteria bacterium]MDD3119957.1 single-stranded DNA-binding protein [Candidatus Gracilibacteria bacterium]MDD4529935.1 single-stranded DNA-binding protein [Candidatus Gracilibacteria bacterium]